MRTHADVIDWCAKHEATRLTENSISSDTRDNRHLSLQQLTEKRNVLPQAQLRGQIQVLRQYPKNSSLSFVLELELSISE